MNPDSALCDVPGPAAAAEVASSTAHNSHFDVSVPSVLFLPG